jgi:putative flippase GtrA
MRPEQAQSIVVPATPDRLPSGRPNLIGQLARYGVVGLVTNGALFGGYLALTSVGMSVLFAMTVMYLLGVMGSFYANGLWSFRSETNGLAEFWRYATVYACGYALNYSLLTALMRQARIHHSYAQAICIFAVAAFCFFAHRYWVFPGRGARKK